MTLDDSTDLLDRLDVRYNSESFDENYDESYSYDEDYDESYDDSAEFLPFLPNPLKTISQGINTVGRILSSAGNVARGVNLTGVRPNLPSTSGIPAVSNLAGQLTNRAGRSFQFKLPQNVATKEDIAALKKAVDAHNMELRKVSGAVTKNAQETAKIATEVNRVDATHKKATQEQNKVMRTMGTQLSRMGKRVNQLNKELKDTKQQAQMFALLPMFMNQQPELNTVTFQGATPESTGPITINAGSEVKVKTNTYKEDDDNTMMLLLLMMMGGGMGSGSGSGGMDSMMLPLLIIGMNNKK